MNVLSPRTAARTAASALHIEPGPGIPTAAEVALGVLRPLVAVLPFQSERRQPALRVLGASLADHLRESLAQDPELQAILISSEFLAKAPPHALELVCRELAVGHLVTGRCHGTPDKPSLYVELADTREWHIRWARFFRADARVLLAPGSPEMAQTVAELRQVLVKPHRSTTWRSAVRGM